MNGTPADPLAAFLADAGERERAATRAPWRAHDTWLESGGHTATVLSGEGNATDLRAWLPTFAGGLVAWDEGRNAWNDAAFIAAARADVPRLLAAVEKVLALAAKHEHGATRWEDPLPVPTWIPELREVISRELLGPETTSTEMEG